MAVTAANVLTGPADVPGLSQYTYAINLPNGATPTGVSWAVNQSTAHIIGASNQSSSVIAFDNKPEVSGSNYVTVTANYTAGGHAASATIKVAIVQVQIGDTSTSTPGRPEGGQLLGASEAYQVKPGATYVTSAPDASNVSSFTTTAISQPKEPGAYINSQKLGTASVAFTTIATVTLSPPSAKPDAVSHIKIG